MFKLVDKTLDMIEFGKRDVLSDLDKQIETFEKVLAWFKKLGINTDVGRIAAYRIYFKHLLDDPKKEDYIPPITRANMARELFELIWVYQNFVDFDSDKIIDHVKRTLKGVVATNLEETKNHSARNYLFELRVASYFIQSGYKIDLDTDCDLVASNDKHKIYVECKRLNSVDKIPKRTKEAAKQLHKRLENDSSNKSYGIIWHDLSFVLSNPSGFYSAYYRANAQFAARYDLLKLVMDNRVSYDLDDRIIGHVYQSLYPGITKVPFGVFTGSTINAYSSNKKFFKRLKFKKLYKSLLKNYG